jgi:N-methylhydantoinase A
MAKAAASCRVGIDIGGTFTDVALDVDGAIVSTKILTDYAAPERAVLDGVRNVADLAGIALADIDLMIHGTTLATNALIERRGARTALVTTQGFRDVIEMRTENRFEQYDLDIVLPAPLIERADRFTLRERVDAGGKGLIAPDPAEIAALAGRLVAGGYESIAIGFLHSYANDAHERAVRSALMKAIPGIAISISAEVSPQLREFERFNTVCANAYVKPLIKTYLDRLRSSMADIGVLCPIFIMHSGGGIISVETAAEFPVRLVESGPAGGAIFAADIARRHRLDSVVSFDMGGTTAKICLIEDQVPKTAARFEVARTYRFKKGSGMPISIPAVEMVEIGAGGGSIASVDALRQIRVGPRSAGSEPGPACYQRGGSLPTVTDADLLLGRLDPDNFAAGSIPLSAANATAALDDAIGARLAIDATTAAYGICEMVDENMANAGRVHAVESGKEISKFSMITFGGAGPLHAARLCEKLGIASFLVPPGAGVGSAIGFLRAPFAYQSVRTAIVRLQHFDATIANDIVDGMTSEALGFVAAELRGAEPVIELSAFMRYTGQGWEIPVPLPVRRFGPGDGEFIRLRFEQNYERFFGRSIEGLAIEIVSWSVKAGSPLPETTFVQPTVATRTVMPTARRYLFDAASRDFLEAGVHERGALRPGDHLEGPAIIAERETATIVPASFDATVLADGCLRVARRPVRGNRA